MVQRPYAPDSWKLFTCMPQSCEKVTLRPMYLPHGYMELLGRQMSLNLVSVIWSRTCCRHSGSGLKMIKKALLRGPSYVQERFPVSNAGCSYKKPRGTMVVEPYASLIPGCRS